MQTYKGSPDVSEDDCFRMLEEVIVWIIVKKASSILATSSMSKFPDVYQLRNDRLQASGKLIPCVS